MKDSATNLGAALKALPIITVLLGGLVWLVDIRAGATVGPITQRVIVLEEKLDSILDSLRRIERQQDEQREDIKQLLRGEGK